MAFNAFGVPDRVERRVEQLSVSSAVQRRQLKSLDGRVKDLEESGGGSGGGVSQEYVDGEIQKVLDIVNYSPIAATLSLKSSSPSVSGGKLEKGQSLTRIQFDWSFTKAPVDGASLTDYGTLPRGQASGAATIFYDDTPVASNKTWTLSGTEEQVEGRTQATATKTYTLQFLNGVYYGAKADGAVDSAFILTGLTKTLSASRVGSFTANAAAGQYIWYILPKSIGGCSFKVGGFDGGFALVGTVSFTNASGYTEDYYVYRSDNAGLGLTTVTVSAA